MKLIADLETTGLNVFDSEIVTGYFIMCDEDFKIVSDYQLKCRTFRWSDEAAQIHKISRQTNLKWDSLLNQYLGFISWIQAHSPTQFWCHSNVKMFGKIAPFDYAVLRMQMIDLSDDAYWVINSMRPFSTHSLAKVLQDRFTFDSFSLDNICKKLDIKLNHHDSKSDALACYEIMKKLLPLTNEEELIKFERGINENTTRTVKRNRKKSRKSNRTFNELQDNIH